jgi:tRNA A-37 threonylcarbamoyl transferase component Bud32
MTNLAALPSGTRLADDYRIERVLGAGGFGITYLAEEVPLARMVTIKEYFPVDFAVRDNRQAAQPRSEDCTGDYQWGLDRFLDEARTLARFDHPNIVRVYRFFREANSGFIVLHYEDGKSFKAWLKSLGRAPRQHELDRVVPPLLDALALLHASDFLHRDIAPDNIIIRSDGSPVLIDFGSARGDIAQHSRTVSALVKPGYSPYEQYASNARQQGPWTDIYSLGATLYQAVTGKRPPDAPSRMVADELVPARDAAISSYRPGFLAAIDAALTLDITSRPRSIDSWRKQLMAPAGKPEPAAEPEVVVPEPVTSPKTDGAARKAKAKAAAKAKERADEREAAVPKIVKEAREAKKKPAMAAASEAAPLPEDAPRRPISEGKVAALFSEWRARRAEAKAKEPPKPMPAAAPAKPAPTPAVTVVEASPKANLPVPVPRRAPKLTRPKKKRSWRPLLFKAAIGFGFAWLAVAYQNAPPRMERQGAGTVSSGTVAASPQVGEIRGHKGGITGVGHTPDGRFIVTTGEDATLKIWQDGGRKLFRSIELDAGRATSLAVGPTRAVTGHKEGRVTIWDLEYGLRVAAFKRNEADIWSVSFAGSPERILTASNDWKLTLLDARTPVLPVHVFDGHENAVQTVAFSAARNLIASGGADRTVRIWSGETLAETRVYRGHRDHVVALAFTPDGRQLASGDLAGNVRIWSMSTRRIERSIQAHKGAATSLAFSGDGRWLATAGRDGRVRLWDMSRPRPPRTFSGHASEVRALSFAPDGATLASAGADGTVRLWSTAFATRSGS